jgi:phage baseplate assembly protein W
MVTRSSQILGLSLPITLGKGGYFGTNISTTAQIADNIKNLLLTMPGERRFNNEFGSGLYNLLFQQSELEVNKDIIVDIVQRDIDRWLVGVIINDVKVELVTDQHNNSDKNKIFISVKFTYNKTSAFADVTITTDRI